MEFIAMWILAKRMPIFNVGLKVFVCHAIAVIRNRLFGACVKKTIIRAVDMWP